MEEFFVEKIIEFILKEIKEYKEKNELTFTNNDIYKKMQKLLSNKITDENSYDKISSLFLKLKNGSIISPNLHIYGEQERIATLNSILQQLDTFTISLVGKDNIKDMVNSYFDLLEGQLKNLLSVSDIIHLNQAKTNEMFLNEIIKILKRKEKQEPGYKNYYEYWNYVSLCNIGHFKKYELNNRTGEIPVRLEANWEKFIHQETWLEIVKYNICILLNLLNQIDEVYYNEYELLKAYYNNIALLGEVSDEIIYIDLCDNLCDQFEELKKLIHSISFDEDYDLRPFHEVLDKIKYIEKKVLSQSFGKCFCITGRIGSGKTHFIYHIMKNYTYKPYFLSDNKCFFIYIAAQYYKNTSLESLIVKHLKMPNDDITLSRINEYLKIDGIKLNIIIDNLQVLDKDSMENLQNSITDSTKYEMLYWILTIRENN